MVPRAGMACESIFLLRGKDPLICQGIDSQKHAIRSFWSLGWWFTSFLPWCSLLTQPLETRIIHTTFLANDSRVWRREKAIQGITLPHYGNVTLSLEGSRGILGLMTIRFNITIVNDDDWEPLSNGEYEYQDSGTNVVEIVRLHCSWIAGGGHAWESHDNRSLWWWCAAANLRCLVVRPHNCRKFRWVNWEVSRGLPGVMVLKRSSWLFIDIETFMKFIWRPRKLYAKRGKGDLKFAGVEDSHGDEIIKVNQDSV